MTDPERLELEQLIEDWNASRLDIFAISKPDDNLDFHGVMRFYFQEPGAKDRKVATKCIRVNSSDTTDVVMKVLVEKFHPDLKMLTTPNYSLYEVHETGTEVRKLELDDKPLYVQLYWQLHDRDGRFLLKSEDEQMTTQSLFDANEPNLKRRLSKREKKELKRQKQQQGKSTPTENSDKDEIAKKLYGDRPTSGLTRTASNSEAVMRKRREMQLEKKLQKYQDQDKTGEGGGGGPLRIFAESLHREIPYKTILFSSGDTTDYVLKTALEKYEVPPEEMDLYCLTMVTIAPGNQSDAESSGVKERVVPDMDCPLAIAASWPESKGELRFYLKKKENLPKLKRSGPKRQTPEDHQPSNKAHHSPPAHEHTPPPPTETSFDVEKEPISSPPVHIVDSARDLPATLEFRESGEDAFFAVVISEVNGSAVHFKLAPTYTLYMCCRYRLSPKFRPDFSPNKRREKVAMTAKKVANMMWQTVKENNNMAGHLAFWMANSSEFLHFLKQDMELSSMTEESQKILAHTTQQAFRSLVQCIKAELQGCLAAFLDPSDESDFEEGENESTLPEGGEEKFDPTEGYLSTERSFRVKNFGPHGRPLGGDQWLGKRRKASRPVLADVLHTLSSAMSLLRRCRVNAALTIQLFSQLFHYMNMWLFNRMVLEPQLKLCTRAWGLRLLRRLGRIQDWAENLGLELAAECHLGRATQAAFLLQLPKKDSVSSHCYKLNSIQLRQLLELYQPERDEPEIPIELIDNAVAVAENTADSVARSEGQEVRLEEEPDLHLPFLLPEDGYSSEQIRGVPPGLREFLDPLISTGLCRLTIQTKATGLWIVHFKPTRDNERSSPEVLPGKEGEVLQIAINKGSKGMGVSIVAAKGVGQEHSGIYVKEIIEGGPADLDGRLKPGDQILDVNGESLVGVAQEDAVKYLIKCGSQVNMTIAKRAVWQHGLSALLNKPADVNKVDSPTQRKEMPRPPPRYRPQDSAQRTHPNTSHMVEDEAPKQLQPKPEPRQRRRNPYGSEYNEWKNQVQHEGGPEQANASPKAIVEYKLDEVPLGKGKYKAPAPYASPQEIHRRQKEIKERKLEENRREQENIDRIQREEEREERERRERDERERKERERIRREDQARRERERKEREEREQRERDRILREELELKERIERERIEREELERKKQEEWEKRERERTQREEMERKDREEREQREREQREREQKREREEREKRKFQERMELDEMSRRERELEMMLEQERREKEKRLQELRRQLEEERAETERIERQYRERVRKEREERMEQQRDLVTMDKRPQGLHTQVHYVGDQGSGRDVADNRREGAWSDEVRSRPVDYGKRPPLLNQNQDSFEIDPMEVERQFQQRLVQESRNGEANENFVTVIRVPVQDKWESRGDNYGQADHLETARTGIQRVGIEENSREETTRQEQNVEDRLRARVDWQRSEDERYRKEMQHRRELDEQLVRDYRDPMFPRQVDWEKEEELRRQREEDDRLREAKANQLRNRIIEKPDEDEWSNDDSLRQGNRNMPYTNGRSKRVKFASVRTEIIQPSPDAELSKAGVKFVHDGKVEDSDEEEYPRPPPPEDDEEAPPHPPPPEDEKDYTHYQRPPPPPKPQYLANNKMNGAPPEYSSYRDNEPVISALPQSRMSEEEMRYATYPGRHPHNNNYPVPKPRLPRNSPSPDQAKLPFKDKMKMFSENTPPMKQTTSRWERDQMSRVNGDTL